MTKRCMAENDVIQREFYVKYYVFYYTFPK